jgi:periplasmic divalent cation tolerance protein
MSEMLLVITNMPDKISAEKLALQAIEQRAAACVNLLAPCTSVYRWQDKIETISEIPVMFKTTDIAYARLETLILSAHPYELPEIIALPVSDGQPEYLLWVDTETRFIKE